MLVGLTYLMSGKKWEDDKSIANNWIKVVTDLILCLLRIVRDRWK